MPTSTVTRALVDLPNDSTYKLIIDTSVKKKAYVTIWLGNADAFLMLRYQTAQPSPGDAPDVMIGPQYGTFQEAFERYTGKIWGQVFNDHADDFCLVVELDT